MQEKRHRADYDPDSTYSKDSVIQDLEITERRIKNFQASAIKDRRAFAVYVLLPIRNQ